MKLNSKQKRISNYFFIILTVLMIVMIGCSVPANGGSSSSSSESKEAEEITMTGNFSIKVDPNVTLLNNSSSISYSIISTEYTVTALDITVTQVSTGSVVGTFNWTPAAGATTYSVGISAYGEYTIRVVQTAVNGSDTVTTEDSVTVNIQPMKVTIVTIVPGGSLDISIDVDGEPATSYASFPENFDSTPLDQVPSGWSSNEAPDTYVGVVNNGNAYSLPNFLRLHDENDTDDASAYASIADSLYGQLSFYFQIYDTPTTNSYCKILDTTRDWLIDICFNDSAKIEVRKPDGEKIPLMDYNLYTWYKIEIKWDKSSGYFKILINDNDYGNYQMKNPTQTIGYIQFHAGTEVDPGTSAILYIDNIDLTTNAETITTQAFTENFDTTPLNQIPDGFYTEHGDANTFVGVVDSEVIPHSLPNCFKLYDNSTSFTEYANIFKDIDNQIYGQLTFYLYITDSSPWAGTSIGGAIDLYFQDDETITIVQPDTSLTTIGTY